MGLLSPRLSQRSPPLFTLVLLILPVFKAFMLEVNTLLGSGRLSPFLSHLLVEKTHRTAGLKAEGQLWTLLSRDGRLEGELGSSLSCYPSAFYPICPAINSPAKPASLRTMHVLVNWNYCQVGLLQILHKPQGR